MVYYYYIHCTSEVTLRDHLQKLIVNQIQFLTAEIRIIGGMVNKLVSDVNNTTFLLCYACLQSCELRS